MKETFHLLKEASEEVGLVINKSKTKYMVAPNTQNCSKPHANEIRRHNFERVDDFTCLGSLVTGDNDVSEEITNHLIAANRSHFGLRSELKSQLLSRKTKILVYKTLVRPIFTYATETWTTTKNDERRLSIFERKVLNRIYGPIGERGQWQKRCNRELEELYNEPNIVNVIKSSRPRWAGHVVRMDENKLPKKISWTNPGGQQGHDRPKSRRTDGVEEDTRL